jgi:hypothetical protein
VEHVAPALDLELEAGDGRIGEDDVALGGSTDGDAIRDRDAQELLPVAKERELCMAVRG